MGLKKKSKLSAEFNMSSLTDIIFLLLIFFMLTSSLVAPNSLNLKLPGKSEKSEPTQSETPNIRISSSGSFYYEGNKVSTSKLESRMRKLRGQSAIISPDDNSPIERVATVMDIAMRYNIKAILAAEQN